MAQPRHVTTTYLKKVQWGGWHKRLRGAKGGRLLVTVDEKYPQDVRPLVRYHEIREDHYMRDEGLPYSRAHELANQDEKQRFGLKRFRREIGATTNVLARNRGNRRNPQAQTTERESRETVRVSSRVIPRDLALIGVLESVDHSNGVWRAPSGQIAYLCTDGQGKELYVAFAPRGGHWRDWSGDGGSAVAMTKRFHGVGEPTGELKITMEREIPSTLRELGVVEDILYKPLEPSPKAEWAWSHKAGDLGPGKAQTETILCTRTDGSGLYFIVTERDRGYPKVTERGIVG